MYGYNTPYYNPQMNLERINNQIKELENMRNQYQSMPQQNATPTNLTQNFQLAPNSNSNNGIKYANSIEEVKNELVFGDTLFINKEYSVLWFKNARGDVKTYQLIEIVEKDEKDLKIAELEAKINMLEKEKINNESNEYDVKDVNGKSTEQKSTNGKSNK